MNAIVKTPDRQNPKGLLKSFCMKTHPFLVRLVPAFLFVILAAACTGPSGPPSKPVAVSGEYRNLLAEIGVTEAEIDQRINETFQQLFYGDDMYQRIYYEFGDDMAYILDVANNDIRSEGMSYGMMFCVQLDKKKEFDKLWKYSYEKMLRKEGYMAGYFAWQMYPDGTIMDENAAPDGEQYYAMALFMASNRWGDGEGMFDYRAQANAILNHMIRHQELVGLPKGSWITNMIHPKKKQVVFVPFGGSATFTDPSYHVPHFYELFALWADKDNDLWREVALNSRQLFKDACHPETGLAADYTEFNGKPVDKQDHDRFEFDAWRVAQNIALDSLWWNADPWARKKWVKTYLGFFESQGITEHVDQFDIDGGNPDGFHSPGLVAMNATAALIADGKTGHPFVEEFWNTGIPEGQYRYFDGCLYLFGLLNCSGRYRIIYLP
jgi:oligosaccharide reducing-end xylanase